MYNEEADNLLKAREAENNNLPEPPCILRHMKNVDTREDCLGDNHPVCPKVREINSELSASDKWMIAGCFALLIIMIIVMVCYAFP